jgi:uncharacterized small protein (DUF1192 family)
VNEIEARIAALRTRLDGLREEFARHPTVSPEGRARFAALSAELERQLHAASAARTVDREHGSRFEGLAVEFQAAHPDLSASLRQLVDLLGRAGI